MGSLHESPFSWQLEQIRSIQMVYYTLSLLLLNPMPERIGFFHRHAFTSQTFMSLKLDMNHLSQVLVFANYLLYLHRMKHFILGKSKDHEDNPGLIPSLSPS